MKVAAASARGWRLQRLRYGRETDERVRAAWARERWSNEAWAAWRQPILQRLLTDAAQHVPHYRSWARQRLGRTDSGEAGGLEYWPVLAKESLRSAPLSFVDERIDPRSLMIERTSGSTGTPVTLYHGVEGIRAWYALFEARWRGWAGLSRHDRWAILGGQLVAPPGRQRPPFWVWNSPMRQLYCSTYHLSRTTAAAYAEALMVHRVTYLLGYPSALALLAGWMEEQSLSAPPLKAVLSNAEPLYTHQREVLRRVFGCPVYDTYGMSEHVGAASECESGTLHWWPEAGVLEILRDDSDTPVLPGETGRIVCTGLLHREQPLIRYDTGDRGAVVEPGWRCPCGRTLPVLTRIEGRSDDLIRTPDGRWIGRLDPVFKGGLPVVEAQIQQLGPDRIEVRVVPGHGYGPTAEESLRRALMERVGAMRIEIVLVERIPRGSNGKFKAVVGWKEWRAGAGAAVGPGVHHG
ncbi:MAG: phenylacetate--CoA ligase family protein [Verrucomicrobiae bacterium]|nr:phenylacetate--CoA ligase family protein [Verrucomicrobiae bacterium]